MAIETVTLTAEDLGIRVELPAGWSLEADEEGRALVLVAEDDWDDDGLAASITIQAQPPLADDDDDLTELADALLEHMRESYRGFVLRSSDRAGNTALRVYEFEPTDLGRRVLQVQGLIANMGLWVVYGTSPLIYADAMEPLFRSVVSSVQRLEN